MATYDRHVATDGGEAVAAAAAVAPPVPVPAAHVYGGSTGRPPGRRPYGPVAAVTATAALPPPSRHRLSRASPEQCCRRATASRLGPLTLDPPVVGVCIGSGGGDGEDSVGRCLGPLRRGDRALDAVEAVDRVEEGG